jgi:hypothetical protein
MLIECRVGFLALGTLGLPYSALRALLCGASKIECASLRQCVAMVDALGEPGAN